MKLSELEWWHWTLATIAVAALLRVATGGPLPFIGVVGRPPAPAGTAAPSAGRPHREPNQRRSLTETIDGPGLKVDRALPELNRLTIEASIANPSKPVELVDQSAVLAREIARALQGGVSEDSDAITQVRVLVATRGMDRAGRNEAHLALYSIDFNARDLFALKPDQTPLAAVLGLATKIVFNSADAHDAARRWCAVPANLGGASDFCRLVATAKGV